MSIYEDREGSLWLGTFEGGLNLFDRARGAFVRYRPGPGNPTSLSSDSVSCITEDRSGMLWLGTLKGGLNRFDRDSGTFTHYLHDPKDPKSLSANDVNAVLEDREGALWIATQNGLNRWDRADRDAHRAVFRRFTQRDGLPNDVIYGILADAQGILWVSTNQGLAKLNPKTGVFRNYNTAHGLQSNEFNFGAYHLGASGRMYFGGINGFNAFYPEWIRDNAHVPPVVLTGFLKLHQPVALPQPVWETEGVEIGYRDYVASFDFAALDYAAPEHNRYAYRLEGFDEDWNELGTLRRATYTNLDAGRYVLRVKASNNDGVWNEDGLSLRVRVVPPPWRTWWAYTLYGLALIGIVRGYTRAQARKLEREAEYSRKLEQEVRERTRELREASLTDSLTGLRNRRYLMTHIREDIAQVDRHYKELASHPGRQPITPPDFMFLMLDMDGLKQLNDTHGHAAGDRALIQMRTLLESAGRQSDIYIRWGGDEFLIVGRHVEREAATMVAERIRQTVEEHDFDVGDGKSVHLTCSIGFAFYPFLPHDPTAVSGDQVLILADRALYLAKTSGRNAWVGMHGTPRTVGEDLIARINRDLEGIARDGELEVLSSVREPRKLVWSR
jgi:diguanylate cyclase (GGDEF)-like protein